MKKYIHWFIGVAIIIVFTICLILYCNNKITNAAKEKLYNSVSNIPSSKTGLLLGTAKFLKNGAINNYYQHRINATLLLLKANKIKYLIISGDNSSFNYNEPAMMRDDLIAQGIDSSIIYLDYAGFRTFDSIIRAKEIFGQNNITIISQKFHNERAIYIAEREHIAAIGFNAEDVTNVAHIKVDIREKFARVKVFLDYLLQTKPKFLGAKIQIPD